MPPSVGDRVILENGTVKKDKVAMKDLKFWLPHFWADQRKNLKVHMSLDYIYKYINNKVYQFIKTVVVLFSNFICLCL